MQDPISAGSNYVFGLHAANERVAISALLVLWILADICTTTLMDSWLLPNANIVRTALAGTIFAVHFCFNSSDYIKGRIDAYQVFAVIAAIIVAAALWRWRRYDIAWLLLIVLAVRKIDSAWLVKLWLYTVVFAVVAVILACLIGLVPDFVSYERGVFGRHSLGFKYPTFLSHYLFAVICAVVYLKRDNMHYLAIAMFVIADFLVYVVTDSRNAPILSLLVLAGVVLVKSGLVRLNGKSGAFRFVCKYSFLLCAVFSCLIFLCVDGTSSLGVVLDQLLTTRLTQTQTAFSQYQLSFFGTEVNWSTPHYLPDGSVITGWAGKSGEIVEQPYLFVDCSYLKLLIEGGVVAFVTAIVMLTRFTEYAVERDDRVLSMLLLAFAVHSIVDPQMISLVYCPFLLLLAKPWSSRVWRPVDKKYKLIVV